jgi:hypothetical protein
MMAAPFRLQASSVALALLAGATTPAAATGGIDCSSADGEVSVSLSTGHTDTLSIFRAIVTIADETWSSDPSVMAGKPIEVGQAFENDTMLLVDFLGEPAGAVIGRLRAFDITEGETFVSGGVFAFQEKGAWVVDCSVRE